MLLAMSAAIAAPPATTTAPAPQAAATGYAAIAYFAQNCARCHGPAGSFFGAAFGQHLTDAQLQDFIQRMANGPGNAPLDERDLAVQAAYHRSLIDGKPFINVVQLTTEPGKWTLKVETSPGAQLECRAGGRSVAITEQDGLWLATVPADEGAQVELTARAGQKSTVLRPADKAYSHAAPLTGAEK